MALTLGSSQALRSGAALGLEDSSHCFDFENGKVRVVQQLGYNRAKFGGFFLKEPKRGPSGTIDFDTGAMVAVQNHIDKYGYTEIELVNAVDPRNIHRRLDPLTPWGWPEAGGT